MPSSLKKITAAVPLALLAVVVSTGLVFAQATFTVVSSPNVSGRNQSQLNGVASISNSDVWAVGDSSIVNSSGSSSSRQTLTEHWNGTSWSIVASPNLSTNATDANSLKSASAVSTSDVWAAGSTSIAGAVNEPLTEHWNGTAWSIVSVPSSHVGESLVSISADSSSDAWAVGSFSDLTSSGPVTHHWNGSTWTAVSVPSTVSTLTSVTAISSTNAWAVGSNTNNTSQVLHWNGTAWSVFTGPTLSGSLTVNYTSVSASSASDVWATGLVVSFTGVAPFFAHFNGTSWASASTTTDTQLSGDYINSIAAHSSTDALAVGFVRSNSQTIIEQWNGTAWVSVTSPALPTPASGSASGAFLSTVTFTSGGNAWIVGTEQIANSSTSKLQTLTEQSVNS